MASVARNNPGQTVARPMTTTSTYTTTDAAVAARMPMFRRISWGAVLAGVVVALMVQLSLNALGLSIGAAAIDPRTTAGPSAPEFGTAVVVWMAASTLLSLFAGGYVAGRMAGTVNDEEGIIHGLTVWGVAALISVIMLTSGVGTIIGGVANVLGSGIGLAAEGAAAISPEIATIVEREGFTLQDIEQEIANLFIAGQPAPAADPDAAPGTTPGVGTVDRTPTVAEREINFTLIQMFRLGMDDARPEDREAVVNRLVANTNLTEEQAREQVAVWEQRMADVRLQAEETLVQVADDFTDTIARIAGIAFAVMVIGAAAAGAGGLVGSPSPEHVLDKIEETAEDVAEARRDAARERHNNND